MLLAKITSIHPFGWSQTISANKSARAAMNNIKKAIQSDYGGSITWINHDGLSGEFQTQGGETLAFRIEEV